MRHKGLEMWAMDSASLYSGESIITEDPMQDRENRQGGGRQWTEKLLMFTVLQAFAMLTKWGDAGKTISEVVEAYQHFGGVLMAYNKNMYLEKEA